jgi:hypothetical protein
MLFGSQMSHRVDGIKRENGITLLIHMISTNLPVIQNKTPPDPRRGQMHSPSA